MKYYRCPICRRKLEVEKIKGFCISLDESVVYEVHVHCKECKIKTGVKVKYNPRKTVGKDEEIFEMLIKRIRRAMKEDYQYM